MRILSPPTGGEQVCLVRGPVVASPSTRDSLTATCDGRSASCARSRRTGARCRTVAWLIGLLLGNEIVNVGSHIGCDLQSSVVIGPRTGSRSLENLSKWSERSWSHRNRVIEGLTTQRRR